MLDYRIDTFLCVCKHMNYTKAAEEMCITQPAVSQHIKYIEHLYNIKLFTYEGKKLNLTKQGYLIYQTALSIKHDEFHLKALLNEQDTHIMTLTFGATLTIADFVIYDRLSDYMMSHPYTNINMTVENTSKLLARLDNGEIDFAIVEGYFLTSEYDYRIYSVERYIPVASKDYVFKNGTPTKVEDLFCEPLISREYGSGTRDILEKSLNAINYSISDFNNLLEIGSMNVIKHMVQKNIGITFLYEAAVKEELANGSFIEIPVDNFNITHNFYFVWRKNSVFSDFYTSLVKEL